METEFLKITILIPSFNQGVFIEETLRSVINQQYPNLELIVIDGGSSDNTVEVLKKYDKQITYWVSEPDNGQSDAINKGLALATGEVFNWLNSDDLLTEKSLFIINQVFKEKKTQALCGLCVHFDSQTYSDLEIGKTIYYKDVEKTIVNYSMAQPALFYKTELIKKIGGVNTNLHYMMDGELWFRFLLENGTSKIVSIPQTLAKFRLHPLSKTIEQQVKMLHEKKAIYFSLLQSLNAPQILLDIYKNIPITVDLQWNFEKTKKNLFFSYFYRKHIEDFYTNYDYKTARFFLKKGYSRWFYKLEYQFFIYFFRLFLTPTILLNYLRKLKSHGSAFN